MTITIDKFPYGCVTLTVKTSKEEVIFDDVDWESSDGSAVLQFIELLKEEGVDLAAPSVLGTPPVKIIDNRPAKP